jgi:Flp pilus assembly pilin Flp
MLKLFAWLHSYQPTSLRREEGQTMAEYGVILAVITAAIITALVLLSDNIQAVLDQVAKAIKVR